MDSSKTRENNVAHGLYCKTEFEQSAIKLDILIALCCKIKCEQIRIKLNHNTNTELDLNTKNTNNEKGKIEKGNNALNPGISVVSLV